MRKFKSFEQVKTEPVGQFLPGGQSDEFSVIRHLHPRFAFDFISLRNTDFCFNGNLLGVRDFHKLMRGFMEISSQTYETLNREDRYHFHEIDWDEVSISKSDFMKCIFKDGRKDNYADSDITAYQFKVFEEARIIGFLYSGIFYLVMFDRGHNAYKRKDRKKR